MQSFSDDGKSANKKMSSEVLFLPNESRLERSRQQGRVRAMSYYLGYEIGVLGVIFLIGIAVLIIRSRIDRS